MKTLIYTFIILFITAFSNQLNATILVANNTNANPGQYTTLQAAVDAAVDGDTIHVQPSNFVYDNNNEQAPIYVSKTLTIIGIGHKPNKQLPYPSRIGSFWVSGTASTQGLTLIGLRFVNLQMACGEPIHNLHISHCEMNTLGGSYTSNCFSPTGYYDAVIEHTIISNMGMNGTSGGDNILFNNDVFHGYSYHFGSGHSNVVVKNSLFIFHTAGDLSSIQGAYTTFENNIFYKTGPNYTNNPGLTNCVFNNNLLYQTNGDNPIFGSNTGSNNIVSQDPLFVNYVNGNGYNSGYNFRLQELSPGHNAGTDGQDIGLYGGNNTWSETGEHPDLPVVRVMNVDNSTVPSQGSINVHVKVTTAKTDNP